MTKTIVHTFRFHKDQFERYEKAAAAKGVDLSDWVRASLDFVIENDPPLLVEKKFNFKEFVLERANAAGIDPYSQPFKASDLGIDTIQYDSFADYAGKRKDSFLDVAERDRSGRPKRFLMKKDQKEKFNG